MQRLFDASGWLGRQAETRLSTRESLRVWAEHVLAEFGQSPALHHAALIGALEDVSAGRTKRLMVLMPPGSAKSTYASVLFPAWWFSHHPASSVITASHTADLAKHFARRVRDTVTEHTDDLGYALHPDHRAAARWKTECGGEYFAAGVHGPITGRRADLAIIDDPIKSHADADSPLRRAHLWNWYRADLVTRLKPGASVVLIMTRWHVDDLGGRLLESQRDAWRVLRLPALAESDDPLGRPLGVPLWPSWEDAEALAAKRAEIGERAWAAMFQQSPRTTEGRLFDATKINVLNAPPATAVGRVVRAWDLAATAADGSNDPDWTVGVKLQRDEAGGFTVLDVVRLRGHPNTTANAIINTAAQDGPTVPIGLPQDPGQAGKHQAAWFATRLAGYSLSVSPETGAKITRATPVSTQVEAGNLSVIRANWTADFIEELCAFPGGTKDDQVDALARAFSMLIDPIKPARRLDLPMMIR
jgi:predicted phage terminase large subunit-like protein